MSVRDDHQAELRLALADLDETGLRRSLRVPRGIDLVSNDYLGFADHEGLRHAMRDALDQEPVGAGASRLLRGHHAIFDRLEARLAAFCATEAALFFGSGYLANVGLIPALAGPDDLVVSDQYNHASLIDGIRLSGAGKAIVAHNDLDAVERALRGSRRGRALVVTESVFSMEGDLAPLAGLAKVCDAHGALLIVDEAHATGLYGAAGSGRVEELGLREAVLATIHTGGKALGAGGAWVAGSAALCDTLVQRARSFVFSTAPQPVLAAAVMAAVDLLAPERARVAEVHRKARLLRDCLSACGLAAGGESPIVPLVVGANAAAVRLQEGLAEAGFDARAVRPPTVPEGTARLRVTVRAPVADAELRRFAEEAGRLLGTRAA
jgi:8-amino-7-oxononanoate synthase